MDKKDTTGGKKVYQDIISEFVSMLRKNELTVGERLPAERVLAAGMNVSRSSVREALKVMETLGMVDIRRGGGAYITELDFAPFINTIAPLVTRSPGFELELLELRELIEVKAAALLSVKESKEAEVALTGIIRRMESALLVNDPEINARLDLEFHSCIFNYCGNSVLKQTSEYINSLLEISISGNRKILMKEEINAVKLFEQHKEILDAILAGKMSLTEKRMRDHIKQVVKIYDEALDGNQ
ncbi:MAG: FadR family transcriptional regulator [Spirochaetales bacterium]|nr:FadR family transcriptional regulator [Spirochaetales bacterium]